MSKWSYSLTVAKNIYSYASLWNTTCNNCFYYESVTTSHVSYSIFIIITYITYSYI